MNAKPARSQLDRSQTHISQFFSSDYGDPIVNRTVPNEAPFFADPFLMGHGQAGSVPSAAAMSFGPAGGPAGQREPQLRGATGSAREALGARDGPPTKAFHQAICVDLYKFIWTYI